MRSWQVLILRPSIFIESRYAFSAGATTDYLTSYEMRELTYCPVSTSHDCMSEDTCAARHASHDLVNPEVAVLSFTGEYTALALLSFFV